MNTLYLNRCGERDHAPRTAGSANSDPSILGAAIEILDQGGELLESLSDDAYTAKLAATYHASIGGHYRHCLDHFCSLVGARGGDHVNYDHRRRDPLIESDRFAALNETRRLRDGLAQWNAAEFERLVHVTCKTSYAAGGSQTATASLGRELMYAVAHAVHHYALIGIIANLQGVPLPTGFGVAPSTIQHQQAQASAA